MGQPQSPRSGHFIFFETRVTSSVYGSLERIARQITDSFSERIKTIKAGHEYPAGFNFEFQDRILPRTPDRVSIAQRLTGCVPTAKRAVVLLRLCTTFRGHYSAFNSYSQFFENHSFRMTSQRFVIDSIGQYLGAS